MTSRSGAQARIRVSGPPGSPFLVVARADGARRVLLRRAGRLDLNGAGELDLHAPESSELVGRELRLQALVLHGGAPERTAPATLRIVARPTSSPAPAAPVPHPFRLVSCSLGCSSGGSGQPFDCSIFAVPTQATLRFEFTRAVNPSSVSLQTVRILDVSNGQAAAGVFTLEARGHELVWQGTLELNQTYQVTIPGLNQDPAGPHVTSARGGLANLDRLQCTFVAL